MHLRSQPIRSRARTAAHQRIYAIGDVHGEVALLEDLLRQIAEDDARRPKARTIIVLLGDIVDRGAGSAALMTMLARSPLPRLVVLKGNHEAALIDCWRGDAEALGFWLDFGGRATLHGFGITDREIETADADALVARMQTLIGEDIVEWADRLPTSWSSGDYYFVHAGIRPGVAFNRQDEDDLLWIREPFLSSQADHGAIIVHGHTVEPGVPALGGNRIGLDTGAHEHGTLSALGLEGDRQWLLQATASGDARGGTHADPIAAIRALLAEVTTDRMPAEPPSEGSAGAAPEPRSRRPRIAAALAAVVAIGLALFAVPHPRPPETVPGAPAQRPPASQVVMPVPDAPPAIPKAVATRPAVTRSNRRGAVSVPPSRVADAARPAPAEPPSPDAAGDGQRVSETAATQTPAVRLTGAELERALAEDRIATRRLNEAELARIARDR